MALFLAFQTLTAAQLNALQSVTVTKAANGTPFPSTTTLADDPDLGVPVAANTVYECLVIIFYQAGTVADIKFGLTYPAGGVLDYAGLGYSGSGVIGEGIGVNVASGAAIIFGGLGIGSDAYAKINFRLATSSAGTLRVQRAQNVSTAENTIIRQGSYLTIRQST